MMYSISSGAGDSVNARYEGGLLSVLGNGLSCPICSGTWTATLLMVLYCASPALGRITIFLLAAAGLAQVLVYYTEANEWKARHYRVQSGIYDPKNAPFFIQPEPIMLGSRPMSERESARSES